MLYDTGESKEGHGHDANGDEGYGKSLERLGNVPHGELLAQTGEEDHCQAIAERSGKRIHGGLAEVEHMSRIAEGELLGNHVQSNAEHGAVGGDKRKEDSQ